MVGKECAIDEFPMQFKPKATFTQEAEANVSGEGGQIRCQVKPIAGGAASLLAWGFSKTRPLSELYMCNIP